MRLTQIGEYDEIELKLLLKLNFKAVHKIHCFLNVPVNIKYVKLCMNRIYNYFTFNKSLLGTFLTMHVVCTHQRHWLCIIFIFWIIFRILAVRKNNIQYKRANKYTVNSCNGTVKKWVLDRCRGSYLRLSVEIKPWIRAFEPPALNKNKIGQSNLLN